MFLLIVSRLEATKVPARARVPRSKSSPERSSGSQKPRARSPSAAAVLPSSGVCTKPTILSPLLYNYSSNIPCAVAFYSPCPPPSPMYLETFRSNLDAVTCANCYPTKQSETEKKSMKKKSKKAARYVIQAVLRTVYKAVANPRPSGDASDGSSDKADIIPPAKTSSPVFQSVASQTKPKSPFNRQSAVAISDDLSISSEDCCLESEASCDWMGNVRALRESHVRLVLRQLRQLRDIERLNRTLHRAHVSAHAHADDAHNASCVGQSACL